LAGQLHKTNKITVWDGRYNVNPMVFNPRFFPYETKMNVDDETQKIGFRVWMAKLDLEYPRDSEGMPISSTKLNIEQMNSHIAFLECLCSEL